MMNETATTEPIRRRRTWRRIAAVFVILIGVAWLAAYFLLRDSKRVRAIEVYELLTPQMLRDDVTWVIARAGQEVVCGEDGHCTIHDRYHLRYSFDNNGRLMEKVVDEYAGKEVPLPIWLSGFLEMIGIETGPLLRQWSQN